MNERDYFTIPRALPQDRNISVDALGLLVYCLSMQGKMELNPVSIWKNQNIGRDRVYNLVNELIENYYCVRIRKPHPTKKGLAAATEYEFFDNTAACKARMVELGDLV